MGIGFALMLFALFVWVVWPSRVQGTWTVSGGDAEFSWYTTTSMRRHWFSVDGYPPVHERGIYWVTHHDADENYTVKVLVFPHDGTTWSIETHVVSVFDDGTTSLDGAMR